MNPAEFHNREVKLGPPLRVQQTFRLSLPMDAHVQHLAWENNCDKSVVVRQALHEYFAKRGVDAWTPGLAPIGGSAAPQ